VECCVFVCGCYSIRLKKEIDTLTLYSHGTGSISAGADAP
jgi:hypothetical protein